MPWSLDGTDSFIVDAESLRTAVERAGFSTIEWTRAVQLGQAWISKTMAGGLPTGPALPMLLDDGYTRIVNYAAALTNGTLQVWRGCFSKNSTK